MIIGTDVFSACLLSRSKNSCWDHEAVGNSSIIKDRFQTCFFRPRGDLCRFLGPRVCGHSKLLNIHSGVRRKIVKTKLLGCILSSFQAYMSHPNTPNNPHKNKDTTKKKNKTPKYPEQHHKNRDTSRITNRNPKTYMIQRGQGWG